MALIRKICLVGAVLALLHCSPALAEELERAAPICDSNDPSGSVGGTEDLLDLGDRAVELIRLARADEMHALDGAIADEFTFTIKSGDVFFSGKGMDGFSLFSKMFLVDHYEAYAASRGPSLISFCERQTVTVNFSNAEDGLYRVVDFSFLGQVLVSAEGKAVLSRSGEM